MPLDSFPRFKDQLEVTYRLARIYQKTNNPVRARELYDRTIANGSASSFYFAANSALFIGIMSEEEKKFTEAEEYFKKCLSMKKHEYQNSIDQKAQAGLDRIKKMRDTE
jgi:tetratricopeptide (TPR) repeat protein